MKKIVFKLSLLYFFIFLFCSKIYSYDRELIVSEIKNTIDKGEQIHLFLNRRGYAAQLQWQRWGWIAECEDCDVRMTLHKKTKELRCHHCGKSARLILSCPNCGSKNLLLEGIGTQQSEEKIREAFKGTIIHRVDSDNIPNKAAMEKLMESVTQRHPCILIGTQMLAKGHHFLSSLNFSNTNNEK